MWQSRTWDLRYGAPTRCPLAYAKHLVDTLSFITNLTRFAFVSSRHRHVCLGDLKKLFFSKFLSLVSWKWSYFMNEKFSSFFQMFHVGRIVGWEESSSNEMIKRFIFYHFLHNYQKNERFQARFLNEKILLKIINFCANYAKNNER